jgi:hypothetical protein
MSPKSQSLSELDDRTLDAVVLKTIRKDDGRAAKEHLKAGRPIYFCVDEFGDFIVREWPDGTKDLVTVDEDAVVSMVACMLADSALQR